MVLPPSLVDEVAKAKGGIDTCGVLDQLTLAEFITSGAYDRHVRSARLLPTAAAATPSSTPSPSTPPTSTSPASPPASTPSSASHPAPNSPWSKPPPGRA